jgi:hypothetical protein
MDTTEWLNWILAQIWPEMEAVARKMVLDMIPDIEKELPSLLRPLQLLTLSLGASPPRLGPVQVNEVVNGISIDMGFCLNADVQCMFQVGGIVVGIQHLRLKMPLRIVLKPFIPVVPIIGGVLLFALGDPELDFELTSETLSGALSVLPMVHRVMKRVAKEQLRKKLVVPNRIYIPIVTPLEWAIDVAAMYPSPVGLLRCQVRGCKNIPLTGYGIVARPCVNFYVGSTLISSPDMRILVSPTNRHCSLSWDDFIIEFFVYSLHQTLVIEVMDGPHMTACELCRAHEQVGFLIGKWDARGDPTKAVHEDGVVKFDLISTHPEHWSDERAEIEMLAEYYEIPGSYSVAVEKSRYQNQKKEVTRETTMHNQKKEVTRETTMHDQKGSKRAQSQRPMDKKTTEETAQELAQKTFSAGVAEEVKKDFNVIRKTLTANSPRKLHMASEMINSSEMMNMDDASRHVVVAIRLVGLRGLPPALQAGAKVTLVCGDRTFKSRSSRNATSSVASMDRSQYNRILQLDQVVGLSPGRIASLTSVDERTVSQIVLVPPCLWMEVFYLVLETGDDQLDEEQLKVKIVLSDDRTADLTIPIATTGLASRDEVTHINGPYALSFPKTKRSQDTYETFLDLQISIFRTLPVMGEGETASKRVSIFTSGMGPRSGEVNPSNVFSPPPISPSSRSLYSSARSISTHVTRNGNAPAPCYPPALVAAPFSFFAVVSRRLREKITRIRASPSVAEDDDFEDELDSGADGASSASSLHMGDKAPDNCDWLNKFIGLLWPHLKPMVENVVNQSIVLPTEAGLPSFLRPFELTHLDIGPGPKLGPIRCYQKAKNEVHGLEIDLGFYFNAPVRVEFRVGKWKAGINELLLRMPLGIIMTPLLQHMPVIGGMQMFCLADPDLEFKLTGLGESFPIVHNSLRRVARDALRHSIVLPYRIYIPVCNPAKEHLDLTALHYPAPEGLMRLTILACENLPIGDQLCGCFTSSIGTSDPYVTVYSAGKAFRTPTIYSTLNPVWKKNTTYDFFVHSFYQPVTLEVFDHDVGTVDDALGKIVVVAGELVDENVKVLNLDTSHIPDFRGDAKIRVAAKFYSVNDWNHGLLVSRRKDELSQSTSAEAADRLTRSNRPSFLDDMFTSHPFVMIILKLHGARGMPDDMIAGTTVTVTINQMKVESHCSRRAHLPVGVTPETQQFVAQLADTEAMSAAQIADVADLRTDQVDLCMRFNTCVWHQAMWLEVETAKLESTRDFSATKVKFELKLHGRHGHGRGRGQEHVGCSEVDLDSVGPYPISFDDYVVFLDAEIAVRGLEEADLLEELVQDPNSEGDEWIKGLDQNGTKTEHLEHEAAWDSVWSEHEVVEQ